MSRRKTSSSDERRTRTISGRRPRAWATVGRRLAVVGVDEHAVGQPLHAFAEPVELAVERLLDADREAHLQHLARRVLGDELARAPLGDDLRLVHDHEAVAQLLGLVHVVGRQDQRHALLLEPVQAVPEQVPRLRVEARGRLVEQQQVRLVDEAPGDRQAPLHPARERLHLVARALRQLHEVEELVHALPDHRPRQVEVPTVDRQVLADGQLHVQRVLLGHDADAGADPRAVDRAGPCPAPAACRRSPARRTRSSASCWSCRRRWGPGSRTIRRAPRRSRRRRPP